MQTSPSDAKPSNSPTSRGNRRILLGAGAVVVALSGIGFAGAVAEASPSVGTISTIAGDGTAGYSGDGSAATSATLRLPQGVAIDAAGDLAIADTENSVVRFVPAASGTYFGRLMAAGDIYTVAGNGSPGYSGNGVSGTSAELEMPDGVAFDHAGDIVIADQDTNTVRVVANATGTSLDLAMTAGDIYTVAGSPASGYSGDGGPATAAHLDGPGSVAVDADGIAVADELNNVVRFIATSSGTFFGSAMNAGDIYTVAGDDVAGYNGDGRPAVSAELSNPTGVALDAHGDLAIADNANNRVRFLPAASGTFFGQSMVGDDLYTVAGTGSAGYSGDGGPANAAELDAPMGVAFDGLGDLGVADTFNHVVRFVPAASGTYFGVAIHAGNIATIAGDGTYGSSGDGNPATSAELTYPWSIGFSNNDSLAIADQQADRVRMVESGWSLPTITSASSATATVGQSFSFGVSSSGTPTPDVTVSGSLPAGLSFSAGSNGNGTIAGTPTKSGTFTVTVDAANGVSPAASAALTLDVAAAPSVALTTTPAPRCVVVAHFNPTRLVGHRGDRSTISGCDSSTSTASEVTARLVTPRHVVRTSRLHVASLGTFRFVTGKLVVGTTVVTFKFGSHVLFVTKIRAS